MESIESPGINIYKRVELSSNYKPVIPPLFQDDSLYETPPDELVDAVKLERAKRSAFKSELNEEKKKVAKKALKEELDKVALEMQPIGEGSQV